MRQTPPSHQSSSAKVIVWTLIYFLTLGFIDGRRQSARSAVREGLEVILFAGFLATLVQTLLYKPFVIPSGSMTPTNLVGDYLFVSKFSYGYSHYSLPFSPNVFSGRIMSANPKHGDVVVFRLPRDTSVDYIKRCVGLPGDRVQVIKGVLHINGEAVKLERLDDYIDQEGQAVPQYRETLPNGVQHTILKYDAFGAGRMDNTPVFTVPEGHFFFMGDNRDRSEDSRYLAKVGYVPLENLIGRAEISFFSFDNESVKFYEIWKWPTAIRFGRIGQRIR